MAGSGRVRRALPVLGAAVAPAVLLGATAVLGGFRAAPERVPTARVGAPVRNGELVITTRAARFRHTDPAAAGDPERGRFVVLAFRVTNVSRETVTADDAMSRLHMTVTGWPGGTAISGLSPDFAVGPGRHMSLHPDLPQPILMVAELPRRAPVPRELTVTIYGAEYAEGFTDQIKRWQSTDDIAARVTLPVRSAR